MRDHRHVENILGPRTDPWETPYRILWPGAADVDRHGLCPITVLTVFLT